MGSDDLALTILQLLYCDKRFIIKSVYTRAPQVAGRGLKMSKTVVHDFALQNRIPVHTPISLKDISLEDHIDLVIVFSYGLILPQHFLNASRFGFINIHPSLLPKWRGPAPITYPLLCNEHETGVTIMKMDAGMDTGDILAQEKISIEKNDNYQSLTEKLIHLSKNLLIKTIFYYVNGNIIVQKQNNECATYTKKIHSSVRRLNFNENCHEIIVKIKAFAFKPGAFCTIKGKRLKILQAFCKKISNDVENGTIVNYSLGIKCVDGIIFPEIVQLEGKKTMNIKDFLNGFKFAVGDMIDLLD